MWIFEINGSWEVRKLLCFVMEIFSYLRRELILVSWSFLSFCKNEKKIIPQNTFFVMI
jgi:hypothetical protein